MNEIRGWAARGAKQRLELCSYDVGPLGPEEVEIAVEYCGLCHTDLRSSITNGACRNTRSYRDMRQLVG